MSTQQITKTLKKNYTLGKRSAIFGLNGKLNINQGILGRKPSLASIEEAVCWQDKMKQLYASHRSLRYEIL